MPAYISAAELERAKSLMWSELLALVRAANPGADGGEWRRQIADAIANRALPVRWADQGPPYELPWGLLTARGMVHGTRADAPPLDADFWLHVEVCADDSNQIREPRRYAPRTKREAAKLDRMRRFRVPLFSRAHAERLWRARRQWRRTWIRKFAQRQQIERRWIGIGEIAGWLAMGPIKDRPEEAWPLLIRAVRSGVFERRGRSKILFLSSYATSDGRSPRCRLTRELYERAPPLMPGGYCPVLMDCWLPSGVARKWFDACGYNWPPHFCGRAAEAAPVAAIDATADAAPLRPDSHSGGVDVEDDTRSSEPRQSTNLFERVAEWIFARHRRRLTFKHLYKEALCDDTLGSFLKRDFIAAFGRVYNTEPHAPPAGGWPLQPEYQHRLDAEKLAKPGTESH
jgi:hypothetical protein